jgi:hypothetical protein
MNWQNIDWTCLSRLRSAFLEGTAGERNYWQTESDLANYDATFAQRIGWKWDYVLQELKRRGWSPPPGEVLDWGCGSGIAHRAFFYHFSSNADSSLRVWDRSALAMQFAVRKAQGKFPGLMVRSGLETVCSPAVLLVSHVLTELSASQTDQLLALASNATSVLWVEPGTYEASRALIAIREQLKTKLNVVAPCTHQNICGMLAKENERHWCHHFAAPPPEVFIDANWTKFAQLAGIDLRSLPLSFLVLDRRPLESLPVGAARVIGHPRVYKAESSLLGCDATGVRERRLTKRRLPEQFRELRKEKGDALQVWVEEGDEIISTRPLLP